MHEGMSIALHTTKKCLFKYSKKNLPPKTKYFQIKKILIFFIFLLKHRLWVLVRTVEAVPTSTHNLCSS